MVYAIKEQAEKLMHTSNAALKLASKVTEKTGFIAAKGSFHGRTLGSLSVTFETKFRSRINKAVW